MLTVWPWPGSDGLRGLELGLDLAQVGAEHREAVRQRQALVVEDDHDHDQRHEDQAEDGGEVAQVLADRDAHRFFFFAADAVPNGRSLARSSGSELRAASAAAAWPVGSDFAAAGPLSSGSRCW